MDEPILPAHMPVHVSLFALLTMGLASAPSNSDLVSQLQQIKDNMCLDSCAAEVKSVIGLVLDRDPKGLPKARCSKSRTTLVLIFNAATTLFDRFAQSAGFASGLETRATAKKGAPTIF